MGSPEILFLPENKFPCNPLASTFHQSPSRIRRRRSLVDGFDSLSADLTLSRMHKRFFSVSPLWWWVIRYSSSYRFVLTYSSRCSRMAERALEREINVLKKKKKKMGGKKEISSSTIRHSLDRETCIDIDSRESSRQKWFRSVCGRKCFMGGSRRDWRVRQRAAAVAGLTAQTAASIRSFTFLSFEKEKKNYYFFLMGHGPNETRPRLKPSGEANILGLRLASAVSAATAWWC